MAADRPTDAERSRLATIADYQFGAGAGAALFPEDEPITVRRTSSGRIEQAFAGSDEGTGERLITQGVDGRFTISILAGRRLAAELDEPRHRVVVGAESVEYVREGRNAFAKFVHEVDPAVRPGDEVLVVHDGDLLGVGRAELSADAMADFETGMAVHVRYGAEK